jgi:hypothetical protein
MARGFMPRLERLQEFVEKGFSKDSFGDYAPVLGEWLYSDPLKTSSMLQSWAALPSHEQYPFLY